MDSLVVAVALHTAPSTPAASFTPPVFLSALPCAGLEGPYSEIYGVCSDGHSATLVVDYEDGRVYKFDLTGHELARWDSPGAHGVAVAPTGEVYVSDNVSSLIDVYTESGSLLRQFGQSGGPLGGLYAPTYLCVTPEGTLLVSDSQHHRVMEFDTRGNALRAWGGPGSAPGQFAGPRGIAMNSAEEILVCDEANRRVQVFSRMGVFLRQWPVLGSFTDSFAPAPRGIAVDDLGRIQVTDRLNARVRVYEPDGSPMGTWGGYGLDPGQLLGPNAVVIDDQHRIYVGESNCHVQVFGRDGATITHRMSWGAVKTIYR